MPDVPSVLPAAGCPRPRSLRGRRRRCLAGLHRAARRRGSRCRPPTRRSPTGSRPLDGARHSAPTWPAWSPTRRPVRCCGPARRARRQIPASNTKILTAVNALETFGPTYRFTTKVMTGAHPARGRARRRRRPVAVPRQLPRWRAAAAAGLQAQGMRRVRVRVDDSLFPAPALANGWRSRLHDPRRVARARPGRRPAPALGHLAGRRQGLRPPAGEAGRARSDGVRPRPRPGGSDRARVEPGSRARHARSPGCCRPATTTSPRACTVWSRCKTGFPPTWAGAQLAQRRALAALGVDLATAALYDGSGLSRRDRLTPADWWRCWPPDFDGAHPEPRWSCSTASLAVAGVSGTLASELPALRHQADPVRRGAGRGQDRLAVRRDLPQRLRPGRRRAGQDLLVPAQPACPRRSPPGGPWTSSPPRSPAAGSPTPVRRTP